MELFAEAVSVVGAMVLSVACGLLLEEMLFGGLVRLFFSAQKPADRRTERMERVQGERPCLR